MESSRQPLWAAVDGRASPLAGDEVVFFDPALGRSHVMTQQVLQALELCRPFRTMGAHAEAVAAAIPALQGKPHAVRPVLESLGTRGLMISDDAFLNRLRPTATTPLAPVGGLFIRACDRPVQLEALLRSLLADPAALQTAGRVVVVDDSRLSASVAANRVALRHFAERVDVPVHHVDAEAWIGCVDVLCLELPGLASALLPLLQHGSQRQRDSGGAHGRNLATLLAAGTRYLILDEDNLFPLRRIPGTELALKGGNPALRVRTFADHDEALREGEPDPEACARHLAMCGATLGETLAGGAALRFGRAELEGVCPSREPLFDGGARVLLTVNGHRGGSCAASIGWVLALDAEQRAGLCSSESHYLAARGDPSVSVGFPGAYLARAATISVFAVDNSRLMPCTAPGRAEDMAFNLLAAAAHRRSVQLQLPWTLGHLPEPGRDRSNQIPAPRNIAPNVCLAAIAGQLAAELHAESPALRLAAVAARLSDFAGGSDESLLTYLREFLVGERVGLLRTLQDAMPGTAGAPAALRTDLLAHIEANARAIVERGVPRLRGWPEDAGAGDCAAAFRGEAQVLADGLRAWPAAWDVALARRERWLADSRIVP